MGNKFLGTMQTKKQSTYTTNRKRNCVLRRDHSRKYGLTGANESKPANKHQSISGKEESKAIGSYHSIYAKWIKCPNNYSNKQKINTPRPPLILILFLLNQTNPHKM